ncbi:MAG: CRTAC1 family protein [Planctomycetota bacterium]
MQRALAPVATRLLATVAVAAVGRCALGQFFSEQAAARGVSYFVTQGEFGGLGQFGCGVAVVDLDGAGDEDIVCTGNAKDRLGFFRNDGTGQFTDVSAAAYGALPQKASGIAAGDFDADGDLDLAVTRWLKATLLLRNNGDFTFTDVAAAAGITGVGAGAGCAWADYDGDGWIDLAVANRTGTSANQTRNRLWRNNGNGTFTERAAALGIDNGGFPAFMVSWCDIDFDGDPDLYVGNDKGSSSPRYNRLYRNNGDGTLFEDIECRAGVACDAMGTSYGDLDGDGRPEIFIPNIQLGNILLRSGNGGISWDDAAPAAAVQSFATCWGSLFLDGDHDGDLDLFVGAMIPSLNFYYLNPGSWPMLDASFASGLANPNDSYCAAQGDVDGDGDQDMLVQDRMAPVRLYMNNAVGQPGRNWIKLDVQGRGANTRGIGTRLVAAVGARMVWREVAAGTDYKSQSSYRQHIGLGAAGSLASLTVTFPKAGVLRPATRTLTGLAANAVWPIWPPERLGDADGDGVRGAGDRAVVAAAAGAVLTPAAAVLDLDGDGVLGKGDLVEFDRVRCDLDGDARVGAVDLAMLLASWGAPRFDFDDDGAAGPADLLLLLDGWSAW